MYLTDDSIDTIFVSCRLKWVFATTQSPQDDLEDERKQCYSLTLLQQC